MGYHQASAAIKIRPPSAMTEHYWAIEEQTQKTTYAVPFLAALMTVACAKPINKEALFIFLSSKIPLQQERFEKTLANLVSNKIVIRTDKADATITHINQWKEAGWDNASDYHFFYMGCPFSRLFKRGSRS